MTPIGRYKSADDRSLIMPASYALLAHLLAGLAAALQRTELFSCIVLFLAAGKSWPSRGRMGVGEKRLRAETKLRDGVQASPKILQAADGPHALSRVQDNRDHRNPQAALPDQCTGAAGRPQIASPCGAVTECAPLIDAACNEPTELVYSCMLS